jgi:hypothetical protein
LRYAARFLEAAHMPLRDLEERSRGGETRPPLALYRRGLAGGTYASSTSTAQSPGRILGSRRVLIVRQRGPQGLRAIAGFHHEALSGVWRGRRSSRLSIRDRIIYFVDEAAREVHVLDVTRHDYRRR